MLIYALDAPGLVNWYCVRPGIEWLQSLCCPLSTPSWNVCQATFVVDKDDGDLLVQ